MCLCLSPTNAEKMLKGDCDMSGSSMRILGVGAHPDDAELGCGATLALFKKKGHEIYILVLTKGEASGDSVARERMRARVGF